MPRFSPASLARLDTCHPDLQRLLHKVVEAGPDFTVLCGHRGQEAQNQAVADGTSKTPWPRSKHNRLPSVAVDIAPYPIDWGDLNRFRLLAGYVLGAAAVMGIKLRWGGDWNRNFSEKDETFRDFPHFELLEG